MKNLCAIRVVAFDEKNQPVVVKPAKWRVEFAAGDKRFSLRSGKYAVTYAIKEVICLSITDERSELALGRTLGRMTLSGIATNGFVRGKGVAGAVMDYAARGSETNTLLIASVVMSDTTTLQFEAPPDEIRQIQGLFSQGVSTQRGWEDARALLDLVSRVRNDGSRALAELRETIVGLRDQLPSLRDKENGGATFVERDAARLEIELLQKTIFSQEGLLRAATYPETFEESQGKTTLTPTKLVIGVLIVLAVVPLLVTLSTDKLNRKTFEKPVLAQPFAKDPSDNLQAIDERQKTGNESTKIIAGESAASLPQKSNSPVLIQPSFDCLRAQTAVETMVCGSSDLANLDIHLSTVYSKAQQLAVDKGDLKRGQNKWRVEIRDKCDSPECVGNAYRQRISLLLGAN